MEDSELPVIALLLYEGIGPFHLSGPLMVFGQNGINKPLVNLVPFSIQGKKLETCSGFEIQVPNGTEVVDEADAIIIPGWTQPNTSVPFSIKKLLSQANREGKHIVGLCRGSFALAESGILNGKRATTHWLLADSFKDRYPLVKFDYRVPYCHDGNIWTAAGGTASIDVCLLLLENLVSHEKATNLVRKIIHGLPEPRPEQDVLPELTTLGMNNQRSVQTRVLEIVGYLQNNPGVQVNLTELAKQANISSRTLTRQFKKITGFTVTQWRINQQINYAKQLLTTTNTSIEVIASQVGFNSAPAFRKNFTSTTGMSPSEYRKTKCVNV